MRVKAPPIVISLELAMRKGLVVITPMTKLWRNGNNYIKKIAIVCDKILLVMFFEESP